MPAAIQPLEPADWLGYASSMAGQRAGIRIPNAQDVAKLAGVSPSTVSRAFVDEASISAHKKAKVLEAAGKLGYRPNAMARSLRTRKSRLVGILLEEFTNPFFLRTLELLTRELQKVGLHAIVVNASHDISVEEAIDLIIQFRINALIVSSDIPLNVEFECSKMDIPVVSFARTERRIPNSTGICLDDFSAGYAAARHLLGKGYRQPGFVGGFPDVSVTVDRCAGFRERLAESGIRQFATTFVGDNTYDTGLAACREFLAGSDLPDSLFCVNDQVAVAAIDASMERGLSVPGDIGVIGVDDIWVTRTRSYSVTTIKQPLEAMSEAMAAVLADHNSGSARQRQTLRFEGRLVERESTRRVAAADGKDPARADSAAPAAGPVQK